MSDVDAMRVHLRRRVLADEAAAQTRARELQAAAEALAARLVARWGARRVWLFGSLAWGDAHAQSDIDLAVEGLRSEDYFAALADLLAAAPAPVDLITLEGAEPGLIARVLAEGRLLDGR